MSKHGKRWEDMTPLEKMHDFDEEDAVLREIHRSKPHKKVGNSTVADKELSDNRPRRWWAK